MVTEPTAPHGFPAFARWQEEGEKHWRAGDYAWMAERVGGKRVLEIGCGTGFGTLAMATRGLLLMALEPKSDCIAVAGERVRDSLPADLHALSGGASPIFLQVGVDSIDTEMRHRIIEFAPDWVVCWLMGADDRVLDHSLPPAQSVQKYREAVHRCVAELAATLPSVVAVNLIDRTAFPWKIKDTARETMILYHQDSTFADLPFRIALSDTLYRKLDARPWPMPVGRSGAAGPGMVPVLGSLVARRTAFTPNHP